MVFKQLYDLRKLEYNRVAYKYNAVFWIILVPSQSLGTKVVVMLEIESRCSKRGDSNAHKRR